MVYTHQRHAFHLKAYFLWHSSTCDSAQNPSIDRLKDPLQLFPALPPISRGSGHTLPYVIVIGDHFSLFFSLVFLPFLGPFLWLEVPRLGVESEL